MYNTTHTLMHAEHRAMTHTHSARTRREAGWVRRPSRDQLSIAVTPLLERVAAAAVAVHEIHGGVDELAKCGCEKTTHVQSYQRPETASMTTHEMRRKGAKMRDPFPTPSEEDESRAF